MIILKSNNQEQMQQHVEQELAISIVLLEFSRPPQLVRSENLIHVNFHAKQE
jgi:hypothetical protein